MTEKIGSMEEEYTSSYKKPLSKNKKQGHVRIIPIRPVNFLDTLASGLESIEGFLNKKILI